ncbi:MAG: hypothetical protein ACKO96_32360, partial [Flammeovirgaceae bacterium]
DNCIKIGATIVIFTQLASTFSIFTLGYSNPSTSVYSVILCRGDSQHPRRSGRSGAHSAIIFFVKRPAQAQAITKISVLAESLESTVDSLFD